MRPSFNDISGRKRSSAQAKSQMDNNNPIPTIEERQLILTDAIRHCTKSNDHSK